ncbi:hypothetical protein [Campylobacter sp. CCUG 57310]|uniref:hypothetical protein n=1 Tax=Campylobacter sp. CCUG 57310 TaxID=2517362 RepID=UPI001565BBB1|nr:hypothetical protein [Campylobacter sp. CCUG 57310]QKF91705.1 putative membrane protein [Campylobacter sp. CCUG 57310]
MCKKSLPIIFLVACTMVFSGCAQKSGAKKIDDIQGLYKYKDGYYVVGDKYSFKINETSKVDDAKRFYSSEFGSKIEDDFASVCIYEEEKKMVGTYIIFLDKKLFSNERYEKLKVSFEMFDPSKNIQGAHIMKSFLESGYITGYYYLSGDIININNSKKKEILKFGKFENPIKVYTDKECKERGINFESVGLVAFGTLGLAANVALYVAVPPLLIVPATFVVGRMFVCMLGGRCS